jgi:hypothetical protein
LTLTVAYVGNKGTHTLGDGDGNSTNPNEPGIVLPGANSFNGQTLHYDPSATAPTGGAAYDAATGGVDTTNLLQRYYGAKLAACSDPNYSSPGSGYTNITLPAGACGWTSGIQYNGDNQNTEFDALQITLAQTFAKGLAYTANYQWDSAFDDQTGYYTWDHAVTHGRDSNTRDQQLTFYGSYDLPFGKGKQYAPGVNHATDLLIGGYQLSFVGSWAGGLPFTLNYNEAGSNIPSGNSVNFPSSAGGAKMKTHLTSFVPGTGGTGNRGYYTAQTTNLITDPGTGVFVNPGLDTIGNVKRNTYFGPGFFNTDLAVTKAFTIWESVVTKFRMDAFNAFNHINPGNPGGNIEQAGSISGQGAGGAPRQLEFSLRVQF